ncbi:MAG: adenosylmethionine--8-amino-7-oxononanoate aminotransferase BioA, partial [Gammaproteobacteria bacterium]
LKQEVDMKTIPFEFVKRGVWVRPFGKLVYVMPPYVINDNELDTLTAAMVDVVSGL